jgi:hypothetical protein
MGMTHDLRVYFNFLGNLRRNRAKHSAFAIRSPASAPDSADFSLASAHKIGLKAALM